MKLDVTKCKEMVVDISKGKRNFPLLVIDNIEVECANSARILGIMIQNNMNWYVHVTKIVTKAGKRLYMLRLLTRANADTKTLSTVNTTVIWPVLEYACQVWHFNISGYLSDDIERVQRRALRIILPKLSYIEARDLINIPLLKDRWESAWERFFLKHQNLQTLNEFLPNKSAATYDLRIKCKYNNYFCKTERFQKSFYHKLFWIWIVTNSIHVLIFYLYYCCNLTFGHKISGFSSNNNNKIA